MVQEPHMGSTDLANVVTVLLQTRHVVQPGGWETCGGRLKGGEWEGTLGSAERRQCREESHARCLYPRLRAQAVLEVIYLLKVEVIAVQPSPTLCDPMNCSLPGSSARGILQARILEWVAIPFSRESSQTGDGTLISCLAGRFFTIWATRDLLSKRQWTSYYFLLLDLEITAGNDDILKYSDVISWGRVVGS